MSLSTAQLEQLVVIQGNELAAQRRTIERLKGRASAAERATADVDQVLAEARETARSAYRRGYRTGWSTGRAGAPADLEPERHARGALRELLA